VENFVMGRYLVTFAEYDYFCEEHKPDNNIVFLLKLNGSMRLELVLKLIIGGVMILMKLRLIIIKILVILPLWDIINLILLVCMIRLAMSGSGHVPNLQIDIMAKKTVCYKSKPLCFAGWFVGLRTEERALGYPQRGLRVPAGQALYPLTFNTFTLYTLKKRPRSGRFFFCTFNSLAIYKLLDWV
jgi:hypothetical protein